MTRTIKAALLFFFFSLCVAAMIVTHRVRLQVPPPAPHQLFAVVEQQLAAFRVADYSSAYRQTARRVQQEFTAPQYEAIIRREFADTFSAKHIEFGSVTVNGSAAAVQVFFRGADGSISSFLYTLIAEGGSWKINDVQPTRSRRRSSGLRI